MGTTANGADTTPALEVADALFETAPAEFVKARDQLAKALQAKGSADQAQIVRSLRKPTAAVWAINQVARRHPDKVERLLDSFRRMQNPRSATEFRKASTDRHEAIRSLLDATTGILDRVGHTAGGSLMEKVTRTLLAAATDEQAQQALAHGRLERELEPSEFGFGVLQPPEAQGQAASDRGDRELLRARRRAKELRAEAQDLAEAARLLELAVADAELKLDLARQEAERARRQAERAARKASQKRDEADKALTQAVELESRKRG
jgi:hypothetical protein